MMVYFTDIYMRHSALMSQKALITSPATKRKHTVNYVINNLINNGECSDM